ncbi:hypothetical protein H2203_002540 [Taxawa tesnikishii (nom. ined.)]|nr:hypothetical protein H2203_002540 [Dothideales sp. JES 119]
MEVEGVEAIEKLVNEVCEIAAWSACVGVQTLSVYERTGILKSSLPHLHHRISATISSYFGPSASRPTISLRAPHQSSYSPPPSPNPTPAATTPHLTVLLLSTSDGRETLVDLTKTLAEMSQKGKLAPEDVSGELIDAEISESVMGEPDLVLLFGDGVILRGIRPGRSD